MTCEHAGVRMAFGYCIMTNGDKLCIYCALDKPLSTIVSTEGSTAQRMLKEKQNETPKL